MARLKTVRVSFDGSERNELQFKYDVHVSQQGLFTTTIPKEISELFKNAGIDLYKNNVGNPGYFYDKTIEGLERQVVDTAREYLSRELIEEKIVIKYAIQTTCSYALDPEGNVVPNCGYEWVKTENYKWMDGTLSSWAQNPQPFGIEIYAKLFYKKVYRYKSGKMKTEYIFVSADSDVKKMGNNIYWLASVCSMQPPRSNNIKEIDCSEPVAYFFVNMIKSICQLNEKIKNFIEPEQIQLLADKGFKLLG